MREASYVGCRPSTIELGQCRAIWRGELARGLVLNSHPPSSCTLAYELGLLPSHRQRCLGTTAIMRALLTDLTAFLNSTYTKNERSRRQVEVLDFGLYIKRSANRKKALSFTLLQSVRL